MSEPKENETVAIATLNDTQIANITASDLPVSREQFDIQREMMQAEAELEFISLEMINSKEILHIPLTVTDAVFKTIKDSKTKEDKRCVSFVCINQNTGEQFTCLKGSNQFNDLYVKFFDLWRGQGRSLPNMNFVEEPKFSFAGNPSIILRKVPKQVATASIKK